MTDDKGNDLRRGLLGCWLRIIGRCCTSTLVHTVLHITWLGTKGVVFILFLLWAVGIPGKFVEEYFQPVVEPYQFAMKRITWSPLRGLIIHRLEITEPSLDDKPVLMADSCLIRPDYQLLLNRKWKTRQLGFNNGSIQLPLSDTNLSVSNSAVLKIHSIKGVIGFSDSETSLVVSGLTENGTKCLISGAILPRKDAGIEILPREWMKQIRKVHTSISQMPAWLVTLREKINSIAFSNPPQAVFTFKVDRNLSDQSSGNMQFRSPSFIFGNETFDRIEIEAGFTGNLYTIHKAQLSQGDNRFVVNGTYDYAGDKFEAHARNNLPMNALSIFFPGSWRTKMEELGMHFSGVLLAEGWIGPCKLAEAPFMWSGWTSVEDAAVNELQISKAFASIKRENHVLSIEDGILEGGSGIGKGEVMFSIKTDFESKVTDGDLEVGIDLKQLKPIMTPTLRRVADLFDIREKPVFFNGKFSVPHDQVKQTVVTGTILATNATFRGVEITGLNTYLTYTNQSVILDPLFATCSTGSISGSLDLNLPKQIYGIDLEITTNPKVVAPMAGEEFARYFEPYYFTDDILVKASGVVNTKTDKNTDLQVYLSGQQIGISNIICDRILLQGRRTEGTLVISNIYGNIFQGIFTGTLAIALSPTNPTTFLLEAEATDILMDKLTKNFNRSATNDYEGIMKTRVTLAGPFPDRPGWTNITGTGSILIEHGRLLRIPLLGGLSSLLSKIYPGLGFSEQNKLTADVSVRDGAVFTKNLKLSGRVVSLAAEGKYEIRDHMDFTVRVNPFRDGSIASALRIVTTPLSILLEFNVTGPVKNPSWNAANLPL